MSIEFLRTSFSTGISESSCYASEGLRHYDLPIDFEPSHPKMGVLVKEASERAHALLIPKRRMQNDAC